MNGHQDGLRREIVLDAYTFDGAPFKVVIPSMQTVGCGATAKVFRGHATNNHGAVAVKVFVNMLADHHQELLIRELRAARQVSTTAHHSILPFVGSASFGFHTAIISRYMKNGNLLEYFRAQQFEIFHKLKMILQVADAVNHLHTVEGLVHGDLKCANVLVSDSGTALLADFGLSTFVEKAQTSVTTAVNLRQMYTLCFAAPELLQDTAGQPGRLRSKTRESDAYAFGMLVLEAITERAPWADYTDYAVMHSVCSGLYPPRPGDGFTEAWWDICRSCWSHSPAHRPTIHMVRAQLEAPISQCAPSALANLAADFGDAKAWAGRITLSKSLALLSPQHRHRKAGVVHCACGDPAGPEAGVMIQCKTCRVWQHGLCMGIINEEDAPPDYACEVCRPDQHTDISVLRPLSALFADDDETAR